MSSSFSDRPEAPLTDRERQLLHRLFSDFFEVPGEWKSELSSWLEANPPQFSRSVISGRISLGQLPPTEALKTIASLGYQNSWVDYDASHPGKYWKDPWGVVHVMGIIKSGTIGSAFATFPAGYRPTQEEWFSIFSNGAAGRVVIPTNGAAYVADGSNVWATLSGISFRAA